MQIAITDFTPSDADWIIDAHARHYAEAEGFDATFGPLVAGIVGDFVAGHDPQRERGFIARDAAGRRMGCIFCVTKSATTAKLRLFYVRPEARGQGLGKSLLGACMAFARGAGYREMTLWTHESHRAACALYAATGFRLSASKPVCSFGVDLVEQQWDILL
jgi:GNAT superfamily N-acetyltransferase